MAYINMDQDFPKVRAGDIKTDTRGRLSLGTELGNRHFEVREGSMGEILLVPLVTIPERELWLHKNPEAKASVQRGLVDFKEGRVSSFDLTSLLEFAESIPDEIED
jgi:hypothetical protein